MNRVVGYTVHRVAKSLTQLKQPSMHPCSKDPCAINGEHRSKNSKANYYGRKRKKKE